MAARLTTEPEQVLPFLAAKVHQHIMEQVRAEMSQGLPVQIHQVMERTRRNNEARDAFYKAWPTLNEKDHGEKVMMVGALFRQLNPNAKPDEAIERIGKVVHEALGIALPAAGGTAPAAAPATQAAASAPFKPAGGGGAKVGAAAAPSGNEFEEMAGQLLMEDAGPN